MRAATLVGFSSLLFVVAGLHLAWSSAAIAADEERVYGAPLPPGARKVDEGRYVSPRGYDDTIEFYEKLFKGNPSYRFRAIISGQNIKAIHLANASKGSGWLGLNIYEQNNATRIFVLKADADKPPKKK